MRANQTEPRRLPGRLIAVEGCDGSGKSTQLYLLRRWLEGQGYPVCFTEWNSSALVQAYTKRAKKTRALTPTTYSLIHATDFADRYEQLILPHLQAGYLVLADRYIYTAFARDQVRGCDPAWVRNTYRFAVKPDLALFFRIDLTVALTRILNGRSELKYYEAGLDLGLFTDPHESYIRYQGLVQEQYEAMVATEGLTVMDGNLPIFRQQEQVRELVRQILVDYQAPGPLRRGARNRVASSLVEGEEVSP